MRLKILLPTDFSKNAWHAINYALELYKNDACIFYIFNVFSVSCNIIDSLQTMEPGSDLYETAKEKSELGLDKVLDMIMFSDRNKPNHQFKTIFVFNNTIDAIKNVIEEHDIEMIVMGTKGETGSRQKVFGSVAVYVMEKIRNCPVIVVPKKAKHLLPKEIVFPTSYRTHYKIRELSYLTGIAKKCEAHIAILHVLEKKELDSDQEKNKLLLEDIFEEVNYTFHSLSNYSIESAVNIFVESRDSDMVAFINKKHNFFGSIITNPMVKGIAFHSKVPILVMHDLRN